MTEAARLKEVTLKKCQFCAEQIQDEAVKCRHCGEMLEAESSVPIHQESLARIIGAFLLLAGLGVLAYALVFFDISVPSSVGGRIINLGLVADRQIYCMGGGVAAVLGVLLVLLGRSRQAPQPAPRRSRSATPAARVPEEGNEIGGQSKTSLNSVRFGLFLALAGWFVTDLSLLGFLLVWGDFSWHRSVLTFLGVATPLSSLLGCAGMLMCFALPDNPSRIRAGISLGFLATGLVLQVSWGIGVFVAVGWLGWLYFTLLLRSLARTIDSKRAARVVTGVQVVAGINVLLMLSGSDFMMLSGFGFMANLAILSGFMAYLVGAVLNAGLYSYLLWVLVADLRVYIEG